jgi:hypothetical protein
VISHIKIVWVSTAAPSGVSRYHIKPVGLYELLHRTGFYGQIYPKAKKSHAKTAITISMIKATSSFPKCIEKACRGKLTRGLQGVLAKAH